MLADGELVHVLARGLASTISVCQHARIVCKKTRHVKASKAYPVSVGADFIAIDLGIAPFVLELKTVCRWQRTHRHLP